MIKTFLLETALRLWMSIHLTKQTHSTAESAERGVRLSNAHAEQIRGGEKSAALSLSLMQTVCLALRGIAGLGAVIGDWKMNEMA